MANDEVEDPFIAGAYVRWEFIENPNAYPFNLPAVIGLGKVKFHPWVTYFVGENGSGKSTLLEGLAVAAGFNAEGGSKHFHFKTRETHSDLFDWLTVVRGSRRERDGFFLRAESFYNVSSMIEDYAGGDRGFLDQYGGESLHEQSHGESFMALVENRFRRDSLFFLDEPEAALSPQRQLKLLYEIHRLVKHRCQFIIATHSPILMAYPESTMYELTSEGPVETLWTETDHYKLSLSFLQRPDIFLKELLR